MQVRLVLWPLVVQSFLCRRNRWLESDWPSARRPSCCVRSVKWHAIESSSRKRGTPRRDGAHGRCMCWHTYISLPTRYSYLRLCSTTSFTLHYISHLPQACQSLNFSTCSSSSSLFLPGIHYFDINICKNEYFSTRSLYDFGKILF